MYVRSLVGRQAGQIQDVRKDAAEALLATGQAEKLTAIEIEAYEAELEHELVRERQEDDGSLPPASPMVRVIQSDASGRILSDRQEFAFSRTVVVPPAAEPVVLAAQQPETVTMLLNELRDVYGAANHEEALRQVIGFANEAAGVHHDARPVVELTETSLTSLERLKNLLETDEEPALIEMALGGLETSLVTPPGGSSDGSITGRIEIPANWRELHHATKRGLAQRITGETPIDTAAAEAVIEAHLARPAEPTGT